MGQATSPLPSLTLLVLGLLFTSFAIVESQNPPYVISPPPPPPLPSPSPPPEPPTPHPPPPPMTSPPPRRVHPDWRRRRHTPPPPLPPPAKKMNFGKKIGLLFAGIVGGLQIAVVVFLVFKRRQLSSIMGR